MSDTLEATTFRRLKRNSIEDMIKLYQGVKLPYQPVVSFGAGNFEPSTFRPNQIVLHQLKMKLLEENGWTFEEFIMAMEKRAITEDIREFNRCIQFPTDLLDRARQFYPNMKFTEAKVELE